MSIFYRIVSVSVLVLAGSLSLYGQLGDKLQMGTPPKCDPVTSSDREIYCSIFVVAARSNRSGVTATAANARIYRNDGVEVAKGSGGFITRAKQLRPGEGQELKLRLGLTNTVITDTHSLSVRVQYRNNRNLDTTGITYQGVYLKNANSGGGGGNGGGGGGGDNCNLGLLFPLALLLFSFRRKEKNERD